MEEIRVLVIDDEEHMRTAIDRVLSMYTFYSPEVEGEVAFSLQQAGSGEDGLALCEKGYPDLMLVDHKLPGMNGLEVLEHVMPKAPDMLAIMITAYASIETAVRATKKGAYDFLPKPFAPAELKYVVQKAAGRILLARSAKRLAEEKKRIRFEFIRVLGHELKAPIGAVASYLSLMRKKTLGGELESYANVIERSQLRLEQMQKLVTDLLDMTRIESGQRVRELVDLDVREAAERAIELIENQARARGITVTLECAPSLHMKGDRAELDMILNNLISNAVKYNRENGTVDVRLTEGDGETRIAVADTGIGMTDKEREKLFDEFVRIKNEKTVNVLGSGLGLSIVKRLAELNNGHVEVASEPDVGTTFTVIMRLQ